MNEPILRVRDLSKTFVLHNRGGMHVPVFEHVNLDLHPGQCVVLTGASGSGKSTLMRSLYGNYLPSTGRVEIRHRGRWLTLTGVPPRRILSVRKDTLGYVSQFLRVIPRVSALDIVIETLLRAGLSPAEARERAADMLTRLHLPEHLWDLPPATFSGGEQQRVNIARCLVRAYPVLLLDEPTASLDERNREAVVELIVEAREAGTAILGIFHDEHVRRAVGTRQFDISEFRPRQPDAAA